MAGPPSWAARLFCACAQLSLTMRQTLTFLALTLLLSACYTTRKSRGGGQLKGTPTSRSVNAADIALPPGYKAEAVATGLTFPSCVAIDDAGHIYVIETGYSYGEVWGEPRLLRVNADGTTTLISKGARNGPWSGLVWYQGNFYVAEGGEGEGGKILKIAPDGTQTLLLDKLPSLGDHHTDNLIVKDGYIYFGQGTATNSAVVGPDNAQYGWLSRHPDFHDVPCKDITLAGVNYTSDNPLTPEDDQATTGAFLPFGTASKSGQVIPGKIPCSGAILRIPLEGGMPELVAWGFRNPFGLAYAPDGTIYTTENGYDDRGSRPVWGAGDVLWKVEPGMWYGWPDYSAGILMEGKEGFTVHGKETPKALLQHPPNKPPHPAAVLGVHASANGFDFSTSPRFGHVGEAFIAEFGDMAPAVGKVLQPVGFKVVRVNVNTGVIEDFAVNRGKHNGPASLNGGGGLERPISVRFSPDGKTMYIADFGVIKMTEHGPTPLQGTGVIWKITNTRQP
jgi:glucose/arabinose dehydrogenase